MTMNPLLLILMMAVGLCLIFCYNTLTTGRCTLKLNPLRSRYYPTLLIDLLVFVLQLN